MTGWRFRVGLRPREYLSREDVFCKEMTCNLERVHVMEQRRIISRKLELSAPILAGFERYVEAVLAFNAAFDDHQVFRAAYAS
ncbi:MAG: hypothetical protein WCI27_11355, partial [Candidatus Omnitrophota bacterium]